MPKRVKSSGKREQVLDLATGLSQMGPPMIFMIDGKQYISVAGGPPAPPGAGRGGQAQAALPATPPETPSIPMQPSKLITYVLK
jgi:hypothetical protein